jgi:transcriptional regulator of heat shock response
MLFYTGNMNERQSKILVAVIEEYTKTGLPVGSSVLVEQYGFQVSPATLRNDMSCLEDLGFLYQPHTSAGRIPTDAGYRYFVEEVMPDRKLTKREQQSLQKELLQLKAQNTRLTRTTAKLLATLSGYVAVSGVPHKNEFSEFGLRSLMQDVGADELDDLCCLAESLDYIDERCESLMRKLADGETKIFIGADNPISKTTNYSMVVGQYERDGEKGIVALIGPKNMAYERNKSLIDYVKKILGGTSIIIVMIASNIN